MLRNILFGLGALTMAATPIAAETAPVTGPETAPVVDANELGGEDSGGLIALIAVLAVLVIGAFTLIDDEPVSP